MFGLADENVAYRFFSATPTADFQLATAETAVLWSPDHWGPGETLVWEVLDDPDWSPDFTEAADAVPLVEEALAVWNAISTADISMQVAGVAAGPAERGDGRSSVLVEDDHETSGTSYARTWSQWNRRRNVAEITECDVVLSSSAVGRLADPSNSDGLSTLIHEIGHCIGLAHAVVMPALNGWTEDAVWRRDPVMSYGLDIDNTVSADDAVGVSLLRPAPGWLEGTGSVSGMLTLDGDPVPFASVQVLRNGLEGPRPGVQVFSNAEGRFLAEGLEPGEYVLWIHPLINFNAHPQLIETHAAGSDFQHLLDLRPVRVRAGAETVAGEFPLRRGRNEP